MIKKGNKHTGDQGELDVIKNSLCPNCGSSLTCLLSGVPLYDVQCTRCIFRAQVKTNNCAPSPSIFGAGWDIISKVLKSGYMVPPLFANFIWKDKEGKHQEIRFYPFIPKVNLKMRQLSAKAQRANYKMFNYIGIDEIPFFIMYKK
jgi:hypothetical protein